MIMNRLFASIFLCLCVLLGNLSVQTKTFKIVDHISSNHSVPDHHHHGDESGHHKHSPKKSQHKHHIEISLLSVCMAFPSFKILSFDTLPPALDGIVFFATTDLDLRSFSSSIFRPPIA